MCIRDRHGDQIVCFHGEPLRIVANVFIPRCTDTLTAWVYTIAKYKLIDWLRRHARRDSLHDSLDDVDEGESALFSSAELEAGEARRDLARLLGLLPDKQRDAIVHTKLDGLSTREAAATLQMSEAAVKVSVHRGMKTLATILRGSP